MSNYDTLMYVFDELKYSNPKTTRCSNAIESCYSLIDKEDLKGMERLILRRLVGICFIAGNDYILSRYILECSQGEYRGYDKLLYDRYGFSESVTGSYDQNESWANGVGFWDYYVRHSYIGYVYMERASHDFAYDPRIVEHVVLDWFYKNAAYRQTFYKIWGIL